MSNTAHNAYLAALTALCVLTGSLVSSSAGAAGVADFPTATVRYSDLNLTNTDGVRVLYQRLKAASRQVCRTYEGPELARIADWRACYDRALNGAIAKLNVPILTSMHSKSGERATPS
jgi:UrcA family protein